MTERDAFAIDRVAFHLAAALEWLSEGVLNYAAESAESARGYVAELNRHGGEAGERAELLHRFVERLLSDVALGLAVKKAAKVSFLAALEARA